MHGDRVKVHMNRFKPEDLTKNGRPRIFDLYQTFWPRKPEDVVISGVALARNAVLNRLETQHGYMFGFMNSVIEPPNDGDEQEFAHGLTFTNHWFWKSEKSAKNRKLRVFSYLDINILEHLFRPDLKSAERMQVEWHVANTVRLFTPLHTFFI